MSSVETLKSNPAVYRQRATECAREAAETTLPLVRARALRAEERWIEMAEIAERVDREARRRVAATNARMGR